jgi:hypothetical protein
MILILTATAAVFLAGLALGVLAMIVIGIHAEQHHSARMDAQPNTRIGAASRRLRLLNVQIAASADVDADAERDQARR